MKPELLAPAGDETAARAALFGGADAIYLGLTRFSARSGAENFDFSALKRTADVARLLGAKVYVCLNTLVKDGELPAFCEAVREAVSAGADAILLQDLFLGRELKRQIPSLILHLSTQAGCCNERGARIAADFGFSRVVAARETPLAELEKIASVIETEAFVQGALCSCFSGQCYFSSFAGNNSGNRGRCKQPCRKRYRFDRKGYEESAYSLSPSDLRVGEKISRLAEAGVVSFKIEGRMRRPEYVSAAVRYYRALLDGKDAESERSDLARAYNRGDYTSGLAFGQGKDFLSRGVQGHIGERVGFLEGGLFCRSAYAARKGDGFKILRGGREVGGALFARTGAGGFYLSSRDPLRPGDEVRLTTEAALSDRLKGERKREIVLSLRFRAGERARAECSGFVFLGPELAPAKTAPLTEADLKACFLRTDGLPFDVKFDRAETENAFLPKSELNGLRRAFYEGLCAFLLPPPPEIPLPVLSASPSKGEPEARRAILATDLFGKEADILVYKPADYARIRPEEVRKGRGRKFLYLPPFFTSRDEALIEPSLSLFEGIYCDGAYGLSLAEEHGLRFFAGTGFNLTNGVSVAGAKEAGAELVALSKELSSAEQRPLSGPGVFALSGGGIKTMDLVYCPFERTCASCDGREFYAMTDEDGRRFPVRRYRAADGCRFEIYNCAPLSLRSPAGEIVDETVVPDAPATKGHGERSML